MPSRLSELLETVDHPAVTGTTKPLRYYVRPIPGAGRHYFGWTSAGFPCLLIASHDSAPKAPIRLAAIEVSFAVRCLIAVADDSERNETLTAVTCTAYDSELQKYFAHACDAIVAIVGPEPPLAAVLSAVRRLIDLFQKLSRPPVREVTGLFGELFVIHSCASPCTAVRAWRNTVDDRFDFSIESLRLEVKASSMRQRAHNFSLEQCSPPPGTFGVLISLFVESSGGGLSVLDLMERIENQLSDDLSLIFKLQGTVAEALGSTATTALAMRFDEQLARSSLRLYDITAIPAVRDSVPYEVSQVRFRSDLTMVQALRPADLTARCAMLRDLLPE